MRESENLKSQRLFFVPLAGFCVAVPMIALAGICGAKNLLIAAPLMAYVGFIVGVSIFQVLIAMRLYAMHGVRRFVFDIPTWFLVASMLACPLALANGFANWLHNIDTETSQIPVQPVMWISTGIFTFLMAPIFFLTEAAFAALTWLWKVRQR